VPGPADYGDALETVLPGGPNGLPHVCFTPRLTLSLGSGVTLAPDDVNSKFQIDFTVEQMRTLCRGTYEVGITMLLQGETVQLFDGTWPIIDGVVT